MEQWSVEISRRGLVSAAAAAAPVTGAVAFVLGGVARHELQLQSPHRLPEFEVRGWDAWYATASRLVPGGAGVIARVIDGRVRKLEGNPLHPLNQGKLCARGQAEVQALYHPDRIPAPLLRAGERGSGNFRPVKWEIAVAQLSERLAQAAQSGTGSLLFITGRLRGLRALVVNRLVSALGGRHLIHEPRDDLVLRTAIERVFGLRRLPKFDIANAACILSFGAGFLDTWLSPLQYSAAYGTFRQGSGRPRGYFVQVEPRLSPTAANADEWVPIRPGTEGLLALALAETLISEGLAVPAAAVALTGGAGAAALASFRAESVAQQTGVPAERIRALARTLAARHPALVLGGESAAAHTNGLSNLIAIYALNYLLGSVGMPGGVLPNPEPPLDAPASPAASLRDWQQVLEQMRTSHPGPIAVVLFYEANPAYDLPAALQFEDALRRVPFIASFASFPDETTALADLVLPVHTTLEDWGDDVPDPAPGIPVVTFQQPVVQPVHDTRGFTDILLDAARRIGGAAAQALPWPDTRTLLRARAQELQATGRWPGTPGSFEQYWTRLLQQGGWWDTGARPPAPAAPAAILPSRMAPPRFAGDQRDYPYHLVVYSSSALLEGQLAHLPWLQAMPDPMTTVAWTTWIELNPETARRLGVAEGAIVSVESPAGSLETTVYVYPGIPPDVVAMPLGQGHTVYGRYARGRGENPFRLLAPVAEEETGALAWAATRVRITRTGRRRRLPKFEGVVPPIQLKDEPLVHILGANQLR